MLEAAQAVGGGALAIDVLEDPHRGYLVNEVNHTMEFHTLAPTTSIDIAGLLVDYTLLVGGSKTAPLLPINSMAIMFPALGEKKVPTYINRNAQL